MILSNERANKKLPVLIVLLICSRLCAATIVNKEFELHRYVVNLGKVGFAGNIYVAVDGKEIINEYTGYDKSVTQN